MALKTLTTRPGLPRSAPLDIVIDAINRLMRGHLNVADHVVTLRTGNATTVVSDPRIGPFTWIGWMPQTADAAAEIMAGGFYVSAQSKGTATLTHVNSATADRTFRLLLIG